MTAIVVVFLAAHGLVHLAVWLPSTEAQPDKPPPPFAPDHSALLEKAAVPRPTAHRVAAGLAVATAVAYLVAALAVLLDQAAVPIAVVAAVLGLILKVVFFNPWLTFGVLLDALVLAAALAEWPVSLT